MSTIDYSFLVPLFLLLQKQRNDTNETTQGKNSKKRKRTDAEAGPATSAKELTASQKKQQESLNLRDTRIDDYLKPIPKPGAAKATLIIRTVPSTESNNNTNTKSAAPTISSPSTAAKPKVTPAPKNTPYADSTITTTKQNGTNPANSASTPAPKIVASPPSTTTTINATKTTTNTMPTTTTTTAAKPTQENTQQKKKGDRSISFTLPSAKASVSEDESESEDDVSEADDEEDDIDDEEDFLERVRKDKEWEPEPIAEDDDDDESSVASYDSRTVDYTDDEEEVNTDYDD